jgi:hypothetical protein
MGTIAGHSLPAFDPAALKRDFPIRDGYLDSAATAQVPEAVPNALRRFEVEIRANVCTKRSCAGGPIAAYGQGRTGGGLLPCLFKLGWRLVNRGGVRMTSAKATGLQVLGDDGSKK